MEVTAGLAKTTMTTIETTRITMQDGIILNLPMNSQKKIQPSKSTIMEVTAGLAKTTMITIETTRITMQDGTILKSSNDSQKNFSHLS